MFGSLWGKKKEPTILGGKSNCVPGMPAGLYSSKDVENLRFHDKRRVWYNAQQVDDALDKVQATLEWWESKYGLKPGAGTAPADEGPDSSVEAGRYRLYQRRRRSPRGSDEVDSEPVLNEQAQSDDESEADADLNPTQPEPAAEPAGKRAEDTQSADSAGEPDAVDAEPDGVDSDLASTAIISPAVDAGPEGHESEGHEAESSEVRAKPTVNPVPKFDLNTIAPYMVVGAGKAIDGVVRIGDPAREKKPLEELAELVSKEASGDTADSDETADNGETAHAAPSIQVPEVPPVPVIPTNPFLRRG